MPLTTPLGKSKRHYAKADTSALRIRPHVEFLASEDQCPPCTGADFAWGEKALRNGEGPIEQNAIFCWAAGGTRGPAGVFKELMEVPFRRQRRVTEKYQAKKRDDNSHERNVCVIAGGFNGTA